ncbi:cytochrome c oxidase subunit 3 [Vibrio sp. Of7-15]|uniref:cytochrome c oxidase subunit 3 n=1 Tax=Vibrio sp. Of7-15 TaxID=2724879 RepID=UPI001EF30EEF|nr:cytochrome c oxidase subunit 3 [Vibrio sp. Of7-15]MCG7497722.1 cytochrome c oxidase subunit 3 [Vibrio sp. Of7-15]
MNLFQKITEKPWTSEASQPPVSEALQTQRNPAQIALFFFLAVITVLFLLFTITFLSRSQSPDFQALSGAPWLPLNQPTLLWWNTVILLFACGFMHWSVNKAKIEQHRLALWLLFLSGALTLAFAYGQVYVWLQLTSQGYLLNSNPANSYFYLLTGIHGLHLIGGIFVLLKVLFKLNQTHDHHSFHRSLTLCTWYWHYLFGVWLFLFALLTASPETYKNIAQLCGF